MQVWYNTNLNQLKRVCNVNNTFYVRQDTNEKTMQNPPKYLGVISFNSLL